MINDLPLEILDSVLGEAARLNRANVVRYTFGLCSSDVDSSRPEKFVRGESNLLEWDSASPLRQVCSGWHRWALRRTLATVVL